MAPARGAQVANGAAEAVPDGANAQVV